MLDCTCFDCKKLWLCKVGQDKPDICRLFEPKTDDSHAKATETLTERALDGGG